MAVATKGLVLVVLLLPPHPCVQVLGFFLYRRLAYVFPSTLVLYVEWRYSCTCTQCVHDHLWNRFGRLDLNLSSVHFDTCWNLSTKYFFLILGGVGARGCLCQGSAVFSRRARKNHTHYKQQSLRCLYFPHYILVFSPLHSQYKPKGNVLKRPILQPFFIL